MTSPILKSRHFKTSDIAEYRDEEVGSKAAGLSEIPTKWTPPYLVIPHFLFEEVTQGADISAESIKRHLSKDELDPVITNLMSIWEGISSEPGQTNLSDGEAAELMVRSSAYEQFGLNMRGRFISRRSSSEYIDIINSIAEIWKNASDIYDIFETNIRFGTILQPKIQISALGHLSNERRVSRNHTNWSVEWEGGYGEGEKSAQRFSTIKPEPADKSSMLNATSVDDIEPTLKSVASASGDTDRRAHYEWIWDGSKIWLVQKDIQEIKEGKEPGSDWDFDYPEDFDPKFDIIEEAKNSDYNWNKTNCLNIFEECGLNVPNLYILTGDKLGKHIESGSIDGELSDELLELTTSPVLVRTDVKDTDGSSEVFSKRSSALTKTDKVIDFLLNTYDEFRERDYRHVDFCFLLHHFMPSKASALALASPGNPTVPIDSTWGIPDGLNHYPHDSFKVDLENEDIVYDKKRCKEKYIDVSGNGDFIEKRAGRPWDWKTSISNEVLFSIGRKARKIADYKEKPMVVMFFVDLGIDNINVRSIPWYFWPPESSSEDEIESFSGKLSDPTIDVRNRADLENLAGELSSSNGGLEKKIRFDPEPEFVRDTGLIEDIASFASENGAPIYLQGSILSHAYYILKRSEARVITDRGKQSNPSPRRFSKLVRDKIPPMIESGREQAQTFEVRSNEIINWLKAKAVEEALEFSNTDDKEHEMQELADLLEILHSYSDIRGEAFDTIENIAQEKRQERGGFTEGIVLVSTLDENFNIQNHDSDSQPDQPRIPSSLYPDPKLREELTPRELRSGASTSAIEVPLIPPSVRGFDNVKEFQFSDRNISIQLEYAEDSIVLRVIDDGVSGAEEDQTSLNDF